MLCNVMNVMLCNVMNAMLCNVMPNVINKTPAICVGVVVCVNWMSDRNVATPVKASNMQVGSTPTWSVSRPCVTDD